MGGAHFFIFLSPAHTCIYIKWARQQLGYRWKIGNGKRVRFWEDVWFGTSSLVIQFWKIYMLINGKGASIADVWDGTTLKLTFRRTASEQLMSLWEELLAIAGSISFSDDEDSLIWELNSQGVYSVQSLYATISFRGNKHICTCYVETESPSPYSYFSLAFG